MSVISEALRKTKRPEFLVVLDFGGLVLRCAQRVVQVPYSAGTDFLFDRLLRDPVMISATLDIRTLRYALGELSLAIINNRRLQDQETRQPLDGGIGSVYLWTEGLDWGDIVTDGLVFRGIFYKQRHDRHYYEFRLVDELSSKFHVLPESTINASTWPDHRTEGGNGSVASRPQPLVFGSWSKGIPLLCVDTALFKYVACLGKAKSTEAEYNAGTQDVFDKDGNVIAVANYTFYPIAADGDGNLLALFDFTGDQSSLEPLSCSIETLMDASGEITGTAGELIEHPADIIHYLLLHHSTINKADIDVESIKTMRSLRPGMKFSSIMNTQVSGLDILDRLLSQCLCARVHRAGKVGVFTFNPEAVPVAHFTDEDLLTLPSFSKTPLEQILTNLRVEYAWNPTTSTYESELTLNQINNDTLKRAYFDYGEFPQVTLSLPDVHDEPVARYVGILYIALYGVRHDLIECDLSVWDAWDVTEGDAALLTLRDGPSTNGEGWIEHPAILLERHFQGNMVRTKWINPKLIEEAISGAARYIVEEIRDEAGDIIYDEAGEPITTG